MEIIYEKLKTLRDLNEIDIIRELHELYMLKERKCDECNNKLSLIQEKGSIDRVVLRCKRCRKKAGIRSKTIIEGSKLSLRTILSLLIEFCEDRLIKDSSEKLDINEKTTSKWFKIFRRATGKILEEEFQKLGGKGSVIQIDETLLTRRKYNVGRLGKQRWLFGAIDAVTKAFIVRNIDNRSEIELRRVILETILEGSTIHSDMWPAYMSFLGNSSEFKHGSVNHKMNYVDPITKVHTNLIENLWSLLKRRLRSKHQSFHAHLDEYIDEFCFRKRYGTEGKYHMFMLLLKKILDF
jgi:IS1 family transposase